MFSLTYTGVIVMVLSKIAEMAGVTIGTEEISHTVETLVMLVGAVVTLYGRYRAGGVGALGFRKQ